MKRFLEQAGACLFLLIIVIAVLAALGIVEGLWYWLILKTISEMGGIL